MQQSWFPRCCPRRCGALCLPGSGRYAKITISGAESPSDLNGTYTLRHRHCNNDSIWNNITFQTLNGFAYDGSVIYCWEGVLDPPKQTYGGIPIPWMQLGVFYGYRYGSYTLEYAYYLNLAGFAWGVAGWLAGVGTGAPPVDCTLFVPKYVITSWSGNWESVFQPYPYDPFNGSVKIELIDVPDH